MTTALNKAFDHYQTADHLFRTTLPVAKNPKLLLAIVKSISNALEYGIESILTTEKILPSPPGLGNKINSLRPVAKKYHLSTAEVVFMTKIQEILHLQDKSPVEFKRGTNHVICSEDYNLEVLSVAEVEKYLQETKRILNLLNQA